jgi:hypothetical protein
MEKYTQPINALPPKGGPEIKLQSVFQQCFDEIMTAVNELAQALEESTAAGFIGAAVEGMEGSTVNALLAELKTKSVEDKTYLMLQIANVVLGQVPDGSIADIKLSNAAGQLKDVVAKHLADYAKKIKGFVSVLEFGAYGDGIHDDTQAIIDAINFAYTWDLWVYMPAGKYKVSAQITVKQGVNIIGAGKYATFIYPVGSNFNVFYYENVALSLIKGFSMINTTGDDGIVGIYMKNVNRLTITDIEFLGIQYCWYSVDGGNNRFSFIDSRESIDSDGVTVIQKSGGFWMGSSLGGDSQGAGNYGSVISRIISCTFKAGADSRPDFIKFKRLANLLIANCEFIGTHSNNNCFTIHDDSQGIHIDNCAINSWAIGILIETGSYTGEVNRAPRCIELTDVEFDQNGINSVKVNQGETLKFNGVTITSSNYAIDSNPIYLGSGCNGAIISGSSIGGFPSGKAIVLDDCDHVTIAVNKIGSCNVAVQFDNTPKNTLVTNNNWKNSVTTKIGGDPSGSNNRIASNFDNPILNVAPTLPPTNTEVVNNTGYDVLLYLEQGSTGTITGVVVNNSLIRMNTYGAIPIKANDTVKVLYSGDPTWKWYTQR